MQLPMCMYWQRKLVLLSEGFLNAPLHPLQDGGGSSNGLEAGNMLWLIQRDFLQGKTVGAMVAEALASQPNPHGDKDIDQVPFIRQSLAFQLCLSTCAFEISVAAQPARQVDQVPTFVFLVMDSRMAVQPNQHGNKGVTRCRRVSPVDGSFGQPESPPGQPSAGAVASAALTLVLELHI